MFNETTYKFEITNCKYLSKFSTLIFYIKPIPTFIGMVLKRKISGNNIRTKQIVKESYDLSGWKDILDNKPWMKFNKLKSFLLEDFKYMDTFRIKNKSNETELPNRHILLNHKLCVIPHSETKNLQREIRVKLLKKSITENQNVVELGCGYDFNLFSLSEAKIPVSLEGYDISKNGIISARKINEHFNCNIKFDVLDITNNLSSIDLKNKTVFSNHFFEQIKYFTEKVIQDLIDGQPSHVIHLESISELYSFTPRDISSFLYLKARDYQDRLLQTLQKFEKLGKIKIIECTRLGYDSNPFNETSIIRWVPCK